MSVLNLKATASLPTCGIGKDGGMDKQGHQLWCRILSSMIRTVVPPHDVRGGVLEPDSVSVQDRDGDSFGGFAYRGITLVREVPGLVTHY